MEDKKTDYEILRSFAKGKDFVEIYSIFDDVSKRNPLGDSRVDIALKDSDELGKLLDIDDDDIWFAQVILNPYNDYEFNDYSSFYEDFKEGYGLYDYLDEENINLLKNISEVLLSGEKFDLRSNNFRQKLSSELLEYFEREIETIISDFHTEKEHEMSKSAQNTISDELDDYLKDFGFFWYDFRTLRTTVGNLIYWYHRIGHYTLKIKDLVGRIFETQKNKIGGWLENQYEFSNGDNFDDKSFNRTANWQLEKIIDKIEEDLENVKEFRDMRKRISEKFKLNSWYRLPKSDQIYFGVAGFDPKENKIMVRINTKEKISDIKISEDGFYKLLYQLNLFGDY